jgi:hypothetical protein
MNLIVSFFKFLGRLYGILLSIIISILLGFVCYGFWDYYKDSVELERFQQEGTLVKVKVDSMTQKPVKWMDYLGNTGYIHFHHQGKNYTSRFLIDTIFPSEGTEVRLLYHSEEGRFRQQKAQFHYTTNPRYSKLIKWSVVNTFNEKNKLLFACLFITASFVIYSSGTLVRITNLEFIRVIGRLVFGVLIILGGLFLIYDSWIYYRYYNHIKTHGEVLELPLVKSTEIVHRPKRGHVYWYSYTGTVIFKGVDKTIAIDKDDYEQIKPGQKMHVYYDSSLDDMMSIRNPLDYRHFLVVVFVLVMCFGFLFVNRKGKSRKSNSTNEKLKAQVVY